MAKAKVIMPKSLEMKFPKLGMNIDKIIQECLTNGGEPLLESIRAELAGVVGKGNKEENRSTGELLNSLGLSKPLLRNDGVWDVKIGFREPRSDGNVNAKIANILEYGKAGQAPRPFLQRGARKAKKTAFQAIEDTFDEEIKKL
jgi:hypothetical protein